MDLQSMMNYMATGQWFSISFVTYDKKKGKAGEIVRIHKCRLQTGSAALSDSKMDSDKRFVAQNHNKHFTRNLRLMNNEIRKVHLRLVFEFNGQTLV